MDALLLDFNGVIVDDEPLQFASFRGVLADNGIALDESHYYSEFLGFDDRGAFRHAFRRLGRTPPPPHEVEALIARKSRAYFALAATALKVVPGVAAFVRAASAGARIGVVSGAPRPEIDAGLKHAGLLDLVEVIVSPDDVPTTKPDPAGYRLAVRRLAARHGNGAWRAVVIEDSLPGLEAGRALGAGCVGMTTSHDAGRLAGADAVWDSFEGHTPGELAPLWRPVRPG